MDKKQWEKTYRESSSDKGRPAASLLRNNTHLLAGGTALDIAMGMGQNAVFLARHRYDVTGVDRSEAAASHAQALAAQAGVTITAVTADMLAYGIPENRFDLIATFYYLERSLFPALKAGLRPGGLVFYETYTLDQERFGRPRNRDFLLRPNELLSFFNDYFIIFYHERVERTKAVASLIARKQ